MEIISHLSDQQCLEFGMEGEVEIKHNILVFGLGKQMDGGAALPEW